MRAKLTCLLSFVLLICSCSWETDSITEAKLKTYEVIHEYENSGDTQKLNNWLFSNHGAAPGHQVFITFSKWSYKNPSEFGSVLQHLSEDRKEEFIVRYAFAVTDSGNADNFMKVFGNKTQGIFSELRSKTESNLDALEKYKRENNNA